MPAVKNPQSSILLIADGLRPTMAGPYGNTWFDTPNINRLAAESLLFEQCVVDAPDAGSGLRSIVHGQHCCDQADRNEHIADYIAATGTDTVLLTSTVATEFETREIYDKVIEIELPEVEESAGEMESTQMATFFAAVIDFVQQTRDPCTLLIACPGFTEFWDAPYSYRSQLADKEDPEPSNAFRAPSLQFNFATDDPDQLLDFQMAYGGQMILFDQLLGLLLEEIGKSKWGRSALFCLTATRGYPLGEHGVVGFYRPNLHVESLHTPLIIRWPEDQRVVGRSHQLIQPGTLYSMLQNWHGCQVPNNTVNAFLEISSTELLPANTTSAAVSKCRSEDSDYFAIQTHAWKFISGPINHLYVKPDDYWEFNDVSDLCPQVSDGLKQQLKFAVEALRVGNRPEFQLPDDLAFGVE